MAFFKFRLPGAKAGADLSAAAPAESIEGMRRRARHRLVGAAVLVLAAVIGFPLIFDTQPRPVAVDVPILIPDRTKARPLAAPAPAAQGSASAAGPVTVAPAAAPPAPAAVKPAQVAAGSSLDAREELVTAQPPAPQAKPVLDPSSAPTSAEPRREPAAAPKAEAKAPAAKPADDGSRARALLDGKETAPAAASASAAAAADAGRFIVQVGAFADAAKARETRLKVEKAGLTTYTQVVETPEGKRTRVRVGPFPTKAEADKAAGRIRALDLPAAILTL